jgi:glycosyltransferase involved in cell wall biosynthesis
MKLVFVTEARFIKDAQGNFYGESSFNFELWERYLTIFSEVIVMARVKHDLNYIGETNKLSSGKKIGFIELPYFVGPLQYLKNRKAVKAQIKESIDCIDAVFICRVPGTIGNLAIKYLRLQKIPFGLEVVGDPWDVFAPGSIKHPLRFYFRWRGYFNLKNNVSKASAALFVTAKKLQQRYPVSANVFQTEASNVKINDTLILEKAKSHIIKKQYTLLSVGSLSQMYKAPDVVLKAVKLLKDEGIYCKLIWLGDGIYKSQMESLAKDLEIFEEVDFKGNVSAEEVREHLLVSDIFVLASRTEGLPRAIIEAMAVGLPCVGTNVGGIPELLENSALIVKNNPKALADKIKKLISESSYYNQQATRNLLEAEKYKESILKKKREDFYNYLIALNS